MTTLNAPSFAADAALDRFARIVRTLTASPVATVTVVEDDRQVWPGASGLPVSLEVSRQTPLTHSLCQYVVRDSKPLVIADITDESLADHLRNHPSAHGDMRVRAYAGYPILDRGGHAIGSMCVVDHQPRQWTQAELEGLYDVAGACSNEIQQREDKLKALDFLRLSLVIAIFMFLSILLMVSRLDESLQAALLAVILPAGVLSVFWVLLARFRRRVL